MYCRNALSQQPRSATKGHEAPFVAPYGHKANFQEVNMGSFTDYFDDMVDKTNGKHFDSEGQMILGEILTSIACSLAAIADALEKGDDE